MPSNYVYRKVTENSYDSVARWCGAIVRYADNGVPDSIVLVSASNDDIEKYEVAKIAERPYIVLDNNGSFRVVSSLEFLHSFANLSSEVMNG